MIILGGYGARRGESLHGEIAVLQGRRVVLLGSLVVLEGRLMAWGGGYVILLGGLGVLERGLVVRGSGQVILHRKAMELSLDISVWGLHGPVLVLAMGVVVLRHEVRGGRAMALVLVVLGGVLCYHASELRR